MGADVYQNISEVFNSVGFNFADYITEKTFITSYKGTVFNDSITCNDYVPTIKNLATTL